MKIDRFGWVMILLAVLMVITSLLRAADHGHKTVPNTPPAAAAAAADSSRVLAGN